MSLNIISVSFYPHLYEDGFEQSNFCHIGRQGYQVYAYPIQCQLRSITLDWHRFRIVRVPPLRNFWGTSRPMRSQHFKLSTNQKPRFWPDSRCWSNLESTNLTPMCQLTYNRVALDYQWNAQIAHWLTTCWSTTQQTNKQRSFPQFPL